MCSVHQVEPLLRSLHDYVGLHKLVRNEKGDVVDLSLVWWNDSYEDIRIHPTVVGQSMMATYYEPEGVIKIVERTGTSGAVLEVRLTAKLTALNFVRVLLYQPVATGTP
jgi:hypothetical protein